ncbi:D-alanyl-D-alanine carboxypeptidase [Paenibacillus sp. J31TS4]|nr:D-alanyl-D-alanine carboxypeptidase [Paenibacillus sp. J31TS4]
MASARKQKWKPVLVAALALWMIPFSLLGSSAKVQAAEAVDLKLDVRSAVLMDASTGQILYDFNGDEALPPASMSKMMTEYIVLEKIKSGELKWDEQVQVSQYSADVIGSGDLLAFGEQLSVKDMFSAMSIYSANDATVALAEKIGHTEENFAKMMNEEAKKMGLSKDAYFINATGLTRGDLGKYAPKELQGETKMSAKDSAKLAYTILKEHKEVLDFTKIPAQKLRASDKAPMINWNWMLEGNKDVLNFKKYAYQGLDGLKTGHTDEAGYCFTGTAERNGMRLISVVMGTKSEPKRFEETRKLLDYGFNGFEKKVLVKEGGEVAALPTVKLTKGVSKTVKAVTGSELSLVAKKGAKDEEFVQEAQAIEPAKLVAPLKKGDKVGTATVKYNDQAYTVDLVAAEDVEKGSFLRLFFRGIGEFFANIGTSIKNLF